MQQDAQLLYEHAQTDSAAAYTSNPDYAGPPNEVNEYGLTADDYAEPFSGQPGGEPSSVVYSSGFPSVPAANRNRSNAGVDPASTNSDMADTDDPYNMPAGFDDHGNRVGQDDARDQSSSSLRRQKSFC